MSTTERMLVGGFFLIFCGLMGWLLATVTVNSTRITVLELRTANHKAEMQKMSELLEEHRKFTEHNRVH